MGHGQERPAGKGRVPSLSSHRSSPKLHHHRRNTRRSEPAAALPFKLDVFHMFPVVKLASDCIDFSLPHPPKIHLLQDSENLQ